MPATILLIPPDPTSPLLADGVCGARVPTTTVHRHKDGSECADPQCGRAWFITSECRALVLALDGVPVAEGCDRAARVLTEHTIARVRREGVGRFRSFSPLARYELKARGPGFPYGLMDLARAWEAEGCRVVVIEGGEVRDA